MTAEVQSVESSLEHDHAGRAHRHAAAGRRPASTRSTRTSRSARSSATSRARPACRPATSTRAAATPTSSCTSRAACCARCATSRGARGWTSASTPTNRLTSKKFAKTAGRPRVPLRHRDPRPLVDAGRPVGGARARVRREPGQHDRAGHVALARPRPRLRSAARAARAARARRSRTARCARRTPPTRAADGAARRDSGRRDVRARSNVLGRPDRRARRRGRDPGRAEGGAERAVQGALGAPRLQQAATAT